MQVIHNQNVMAKAKKTTKNVTILPPEQREAIAAANRGNVIDAADGAAEATREAVQTDVVRAQIGAEIVTTGQQTTPTPLIDTLPSREGLKDELTATEDSGAWNRKGALVPEIKLRESSNVLARFEYVPSPLILPSGRKSRYQMLTCSDNGLEVGKPFADSYTLIANDAFIGLAETLSAGFDKLGVKHHWTTTGTLMERERQFLSLRMKGNEGETTLKLGRREFVQFINLLNSIPSNAGCTLTIANNSFCACCRNTFARVLHGRDGAKLYVALKHCKGMKARLAEVPLIVEAFFSDNSALFAQLKQWEAFPAGLIDAERMFAAFLNRTAKDELTDKTEISTRTANMGDKLVNLFAGTTGSKTSDGKSALDLFSAITEYYTHFSAGDSDNQWKQFQSSEAGDGLTSKQTFFEWLVKATQEKSHWEAIARVGETLLVSYRKGKASKGK